MFEPTSRYAAIETAALESADADGQARTIVYVKRRFLPDPAALTTLVEHPFAEGERLDTITARYIGDPEQFWRVCDANGVLHPAELEEVGRSIRIALAQV